MNTDDTDLYLRLSEAQSPTIPVVTCRECDTVFEATFRRVPDPVENNLPEPRIVETPGTLGGRPRIDGTRIGVEHIWLFHERGDDATEIANRHFRGLSEAHVSEAIEWAHKHPDRMAVIRRENMDLQLQHDIFHSAVKAAVEECLEEIWPVLVNVRSRDADALTPIASLLRNGFENADGLDVDIDTDTGQVIIDVADELVTSRDGAEDSTDEQGSASKLGSESEADTDF